MSVSLQLYHVVATLSMFLDKFSILGNSIWSRRKGWGICKCQANLLSVFLFLQPAFLTQEGDFGISIPFWGFELDVFWRLLGFCSGPRPQETERYKNKTKTKCHQKALKSHLHPSSKKNKILNQSKKKKRRTFWAWKACSRDTTWLIQMEKKEHSDKMMLLICFFLVKSKELLSDLAAATL